MGHNELIAEAIEAFGEDYGYAVSILKAAHTIRNRQSRSRQPESVVDSKAENGD